MNQVSCNIDQVSWCNITAQSAGYNYTEQASRKPDNYLVWEVLSGHCTHSSASLRPPRTAWDRVLVRTGLVSVLRSLHRSELEIELGISAGFDSVK